MTTEPSTDPTTALPSIRTAHHPRGGVDAQRVGAPRLVLRRSDRTASTAVALAAPAMPVEALAAVSRDVR